jgi:uncharacterized membrane protein (DUF106 family)
MKNVFRKIITTSMAVQFASGKLSMIFQTVTAATVISMKFHISFLYTLLGCIITGLLFAIFFIKSGWMNKELNRINQLNGLEGIIIRIEKKIDEATHG